eukprot:jgi/Ulvmu1/4911/UM201_0003.1
MLGARYRTINARKQGDADGSMPATSARNRSSVKMRCSLAVVPIIAVLSCIYLMCSPAGIQGKENAVIVILARNEEADALTVTIANFEEMFNSRYSYPYVFLNDVPFTQDFKAAMVEVASGLCTFATIPREYWEVPQWINHSRVEEGMQKMEKDGVIYGSSLSYRSMCRFNSGFFFRMPELAKYDYYWRLEPGVRFLCHIRFDPFQYIRTHRIKYSFVIMLPEIAKTVPQLFQLTTQYQRSHQLPHDHLDRFRNHHLKWNLCHYWSNFEIADLNFFRSEQYIDYFNYLDKTGGFFYHRYGDAPVHSLATALFLDPGEVHFFDEIGYEHPPFAHLPVGKAAKAGECLTKEQVERGGEGSIVLDWSSNSCLKRWLWRWRDIRAHRGELLEAHPDQDIRDLANRVRRRAQRRHQKIHNSVRHSLQ